MQADGLVERILISSRIPSAKRRREIARELRSHIEDFASAAHASGQSDAEIDRMLLDSFGDPQQFGRNFAWVYRRERALARMAGFFASTVLVAVLVSAGIIAAQACLAAGRGTPFFQTFGSRHTIIELTDILATAAAYIALLSFEKHSSLAKSVLLLLLISAALVGLLSAAGMRPTFLIFGAANALFLRLVQRILADRTARFLLVAACFALLGIFFWTRYPVTPFSAALASWLAMGVGYQAMTGLAARVDRGLEKLQRL